MNLQLAAGTDKPAAEMPELIGCQPPPPLLLSLPAASLAAEAAARE